MIFVKNVNHECYADHCEDIKYHKYNTILYFKNK